MTDLASLMADEPQYRVTQAFTAVEQEYPLKASEVAAIREFRDQVDATYPIPIWRAVVDALLGHGTELEAREQALLARVAELEALLASLYAPIQTTFGATLEGRTE